MAKKVEATSNAHHSALVIAVVGICANFVPAQQSKAQTTARRVTISEPGIYELAGLFEQADIVALVKVVSGDTESYDVARYETEVLKNFKGTSVGETIYFEPSTLERLGWESILFLRKAPDVITPQSSVGRPLRESSLCESLQSGL